MKNWTLIVLLICTMSKNQLSAQDGWRVLPIRSKQEFQQGLPGGEGEQHPHSITRCLNHPDVIYLSHDVGGAWRSIDGGDTWQKCLDHGLFLPFGQSIAADPQDPKTVFITVDNSYNYLAQEFEGLYRSKDGGDNWELVLQTDVNYNSGRHRICRHNIVSDLTTVEGDAAQCWYAAFPENGLFRSENGGDTWDKVASLAGHAVVYGFWTHPSDGKTIYAGSDKGFYVSTNRGEGLEKTGDLPDGPVTSIAVHPVNAQNIFVTIRNKGLYLSENGGGSFDLIKAMPAAKVVLNPGFPEKLYLIGLSQNSEYSDDGGASWQKFGPTTTFPGLGRENGWRRWIDGDLSGLVPNPLDKDEAVAFSRSTLFKTTNGGAGFAESAAGFTGNAWSWWNGAAAFDRLDAQRIAFFNNDVGMKITLTGGDWFEENTNPNAWTWYQEGKISWFGTYSGDFQPLEGSKVIVASVGNYFDTQLMRSSNNGKSWTLVTEGDEEEDMNLFVSFHPEDPDFVYTGNKFSTDAGKTFTPFDFGGQYGAATLVGMCSAQPDVIFAVDGERRTILRSENRGQDWDEYVRPGWRFIRLDNLPTFAADPADPDKIYTLDADYDLAVYDGADWTSLGVLDLAGGHESANFVRTVTVDPNRPEIIYAGMFENGISCVFRSLNGGEDWEDITENLPQNGMSAMAVNPHTGDLYKGSCIGTWIYPSSYDAKVGSRSVRPESTELYANYPNPFNPRTNLFFNIEEASRVTVSVFNLRGQNIRTLINGFRPPGEHSIVWDGEDGRGERAGSGVYLFRLQAGMITSIRKGILLQ